MCLCAVNCRYPKDKGPSGHGWKIFHKVGDKFVSPYFHKNTAYEIKTWYTSSNGLARCSSSGKVSKLRYKTGFHLFQTRKAAREWCSLAEFSVRKVLYKDAVVQGIQGGDFVIVAKKMKIVE